MLGKNDRNPSADNSLHCRPSHCCRPRWFQGPKQVSKAFSETFDCLSSQGGSITKSRQTFPQCSKFADEGNRCGASKIARASCSRSQISSILLEGVAVFNTIGSLAKLAESPAFPAIDFDGARCFGDPSLAGTGELTAPLDV